MTCTGTSVLGHDMSSAVGLGFRGWRPRVLPPRCIDGFPATVFVVIRPGFCGGMPSRVPQIKEEAHEIPFKGNCPETGLHLSFGRVAACS